MAYSHEAPPMHERSPAAHPTTVPSPSSHQPYPLVGQFNSSHTPRALDMIPTLPHNEVFCMVSSCTEKLLEPAPSTHMSPHAEHVFSLPSHISFWQTRQVTAAHLHMASRLPACPNGSHPSRPPVKLPCMSCFAATRTSPYQAAVLHASTSSPVTPAL